MSAAERLKSFADRILKLMDERDEIERHIRWEMADAVKQDWTRGHIYACTIQNGMVVKLGFTTNLEQRLAVLGVTLRERPTLLGSVQAFRQQETWLHQRLWKHRAEIGLGKEVYWFDKVRVDVEGMLALGVVPVSTRVQSLIDDGLVTIPQVSA